MARFKFLDAEYDFVDPDDLETREGVDIERATGSSMIRGEMSFYGLVWISIRRKVPSTTFEDIMDVKFFKAFEWMEEPDAPLPPTLNGDAESSTVDAPTTSPPPTDTGTPG